MLSDIIVAIVDSIINSCNALLCDLSFIDTKLMASSCRQVPFVIAQSVFVY